MGGAEGYGGASAAPELVVGSVKGNIGHLNTASGVAGLVKAALCVRYNSIPPTAHLNDNQDEASPAGAGRAVPDLNPLVEWADLPLRVAVEPEEFGNDDEPIRGAAAALPRIEALCGVRRVAVSAFGIGGTNASIVLARPPERLARFKAGQGEVEKEGRAYGGHSSGQEIAAGTSKPSRSRRPHLHVVELSTPRATAAMLRRCRRESTGGADDAAFEQLLLSRAATRAALERSQMQREQRRKRKMGRGVGAGYPSGLSSSGAPSTARAARWATPRPPPVSRERGQNPREVVFVFVGQGGAYEGMGSGLRRSGLLSRQPPSPLHGSRDCAASSPRCSFLAQSVMNATDPSATAAAAAAVVGIFDASLAIADALTERHGVRVAACLGHSLGEWVCAAFAGLCAETTPAAIVGRPPRRHRALVA